MWDQWVCILLALGTEQGQCCSGDNATGEAALVKGKGIYFFISLLISQMWLDLPWPSQVPAAVPLPALSVHPCGKRVLHVCILVLLQQARDGARNESADPEVFSHVFSGWN